MGLSGNMIQAVLKGLKTDLSSSELRKAVRVGMRIRIKLVPIVNGMPQRPIQVWCRDISSHGVSFVHSQTLQLGLIFQLDLPRDADKTMKLFCQITRRQKIEGSYVVGAKFVDEREANSRSVVVTRRGEPDEQEVQRIRRAVMS